MNDRTRRAYAIGVEYEASLDDADRRRGAHFTPHDVAEALVGIAAAALAADLAAGVDGDVDGGPRPGPRIIDPSCGGGVFLVAAAEWLLARGYGAATIVNELVVGVDLDPGAVEAAGQALSEWAEAAGASDVTPQVVVANSLLDPLPYDGEIDLVIGNPPFQNQLGSNTARTADERSVLAERYGAASKGYVDAAGLFLLRSLSLARPGGVVCLIEPRSLLAARDAAGVRAAVRSSGAMVSVWLPAEPIFAAHVDVFAPVIVTDVQQGSVTVLGGRTGEMGVGTVAAESMEHGTWSAIWAAANGTPIVAAPGAVTAASSSPRAACEPTPIAAVVVDATAGFRDQFYGVLPHLRTERPEVGARVITVGMIDPFELSWSTRRSKIGGSDYVAPWVDRAALRTDDTALDAWIERLAVPKVLVATQTRVIEVAVDEVGDSMPLTPVVAMVPAERSDERDSMVPSDFDVRWLACALTVPAASAWAAARFGGGGLSATALKLSASQVATVPMPVDHGAWREAVHLSDELARTTADPQDGQVDDERAVERWRSFGRVLNASWAIDDEALVTWWLERLPQMSSRRRIRR